MLAALREMIVSHPKVHAESARARFVRMGPQTLEIELFGYVLTTNWDEFVEIRVSSFLQRIEHGSREIGPDGLTAEQELDEVSKAMQVFVGDQYRVDLWGRKRRTGDGTG